MAEQTNFRSIVLLQTKQSAQTDIVYRVNIEGVNAWVAWTFCEKIECKWNEIALSHWVFTLHCAIFPLYWLLLLRIINAISQDTQTHTHTGIQADTPCWYLHLCSLHRMASVAAVPLWPCPFAVLHFQLIASVGEQKSPLFQCAKCAG